MIFNMTGGSGAGFNFKIVSIYQMPAVPSENTICVETGDPITGWAFTDGCPFDGSASKTSGEVLYESLINGTNYKFTKVNSGKAAWIKIKGVSPLGVKYRGIMTLSTDKNACTVSVYSAKTSNTTPVATAEAKSTIEHRGVTYHYAVALVNSDNGEVSTYAASLLDFSYKSTAESLLLWFEGEGTVWFEIDKYSATPFNALKNNYIEVHPISAKQLIDCEWEYKPVTIYQDGAWKEPFVYLFYDGTVNEQLTGGINGTVSGESLYFWEAVNASYNNTYTTKAKVDLTNYKSVKALVRSTNTEKDVYFRLSVSDSAANGDRFLSSAIVAGKYSFGSFENEVREVALDISSLNGTYYLGYAWGVNSGGSNAEIVGYVDRWWLE